jgi:hypothetical protein
MLLAVIKATQGITRRDWRPTPLKTISLLGLCFAFAAIAIALLTLQTFAAKQQLYRSAFVWQVDLRAFRASFSPHSFIATLIVVGVAHWWDSVDKWMHHLQPVLVMSKGPVLPRRGAANSYQSSYWLWASAKAASNKHWLLCMVTIGTTLSQVRKLTSYGPCQFPGLDTRSLVFRGCQLTMPTVLNTPKQH